MKSGQRQMLESWKKADWLQIGDELYRRAVASSNAGVIPPSEDRRGIILYSGLEKRLLAAPAQESRHGGVLWEWAFEPLIYKILSGNALWACLGHFEGSRTFRRELWTYYFSEDLSWDSNKRTGPRLAGFARAFRALSFNANHRKLASQTYFLTSKLVEEVVPEDGLPHLDFAYGSPLLVALQGNPFPWVEKALGSSRTQFLKVDLRPVSSCLSKELDPGRVLENQLSDEEVHAYLEKDISVGQGTKLRGDVFQLATFSDSCAQGYARALRECLLQPPQLDDGNFKPWEYFEHILSAADNRERISRYAPWILDVAPSTCAIVTIPGWLPPEGLIGRSAAMIIAIKRPLKLRELLGLDAAFKMASGHVAKEAGFNKGKHSEENWIAHELAWPTSVLQKHRTSFPAIVGFAADFLDLWIRWVRREFGKTPPEYINRLLEQGPSQELLDLVLAAAWYKVMDSGKALIPCHEPATSSYFWTWQELSCADALREWLDWQVEPIGEWALRNQVVGKAANETKTWLLSFLIASLSHSLGYAFSRCKSLSGWNPPPKGLRRAAVALKLVDRGNEAGPSLEIQNRGDTFIPQSVEKVAGKHSSNALRELETWCEHVHIQDFGTIPDTSNPESCWWRGKITLKHF